MRPREKHLIRQTKEYISQVKLLSEYAIKKYFCVIGDFLHPSGLGEQTFEVNSGIIALGSVCQLEYSGMSTN